jgi:hypothetical protein
MLAALDSYSVLLLVPMTCVPVQLLYLKAGQRYDLGPGTYVSTGAFLAATASLSADHSSAMRMLAVLLATLVGAFALRLFALAFGRPSDFTLISFGQLWATPALIDYELQHLTKGSGVSIQPIPYHPSFVALAACGFAAVVGYAISKTSLPDRLVALTEAPVQYRLLLGSPLSLAIKLEVLALGIYLAAGILLRLTVNDLSASTFGAEGIWCVLAAAPTPRSSGFWVLLGPLAATSLRFLIKSIVPAQFATMAVYGALAVVLIVVSTRAPEGSRDAGA